MKTKEQIRKETKELLKKQSKAERNQKSLLIKKKLFLLPEFKEANIIMFYVSTEFEVDTTEMIDDALKMGKRIAVPYIFERKNKMYPCLIKDRTEDLAKGPCGIKQPTESWYKKLKESEIDLVVVPGIAFSRGGVRLGRGGGYYDNFLKVLPKRVHKIGIAYSLQVLSDLPHDKQDVPVEKLITD